MVYMSSEIARQNDLEEPTKFPTPARCGEQGPYGTEAVLLFPIVFCPSIDPAVGTIAPFANFFGFFARPVGGLLFGAFAGARLPILTAGIVVCDSGIGLVMPLVRLPAVRLVCVLVLLEGKGSDLTDVPAR